MLLFINSLIFVLAVMMVIRDVKQYGPEKNVQCEYIRVDRVFQLNKPHGQEVKCYFDGKLWLCPKPSNHKCVQFSEEQLKQGYYSSVWTFHMDPDDVL